MDRIKPDTDEEYKKYIGDKLNNAWHEGISTEEWITDAKIEGYLD